MLVHAFVLSRVDYCNDVLNGVCAVHMRPLQSALNGAARLVTTRCKSDHISDAMVNDLHWLPVKQRLQYKLSVLMNKCLHLPAPSYLVEMCTPVSANVNRRHLRSAAHGDLTIPGTRTKRYGPRSFSVAGPTQWNSLSLAVCDPSLSFNGVCGELKPELFREAIVTSPPRLQLKSEVRTYNMPMDNAQYSP
jgi:hypothetical protein